MQYTQSFGEAILAKSHLQITQIRGFKEVVSNCIFNIQQIERFHTTIFFVQKTKIPPNSWLYYPFFFFSFNSHSSPISLSNLYFTSLLDLVPPNLR